MKEGGAPQRDIKKPQRLTAVMIVLSFIDYFTSSNCASST